MTNQISTNCKDGNSRKSQTVEELESWSLQKTGTLPMPSSTKSLTTDSREPQSCTTEKERIVDFYSELMSQVGKADRPDLLWEKLKNIKRSAPCQNQ